MWYTHIQQQRRRQYSSNNNNNILYGFFLLHKTDIKPSISFTRHPNVTEFDIRIHRTTQAYLPYLVLSEYWPYTIFCNIIYDEKEKKNRSIHSFNTYKPNFIVEKPFKYMCVMGVYSFSSFFCWKYIYFRILCVCP